MKYLLFIISTFCISHICSAQSEIQRWDYGIGVGYNYLRLIKDFDEVERHIEGNHSYQGQIMLTYRLGKNFWLGGNLGITHAKCLGNRKLVSVVGNFWSSWTWTRYDTVSIEYLLVDIPLFLRWQIKSFDDNEIAVKLFLDLGLSIKAPFANSSEFSYRTQTGSQQSSSYHSGNLKIQTLRPYFAVGFFVGDHFSASFSLAGAKSFSKENPNNTFAWYNSSINTLTLSYYL